ncbi:hypothetical protein TNCT_626531 [Trichonephila clavata]|uniref:Uncharacterized protein n=1 Tax=Trichonephila clavata TaxID=2740835 RepID=A0A8X6G842_TRICU|nr:hypothetical protein TNCT_626531 [Trichonephila clavata]
MENSFPHFALQIRCPGEWSGLKDAVAPFFLWCCLTSPEIWSLKMEFVFSVTNSRMQNEEAKGNKELMHLIRGISSGRCLRLQIEVGKADIWEL